MVWIKGLLVLLSLLFSVSTYAQQCQCVVDVGNQNRRIWGSWALECGGHGGHGDCPKTNIDSVVHSPGMGAMTGSMLVAARYNSGIVQSWQKIFPDDHQSAFKGPIWTSDGWEWSNVCSCDGYNQRSCSRSPRSQWTNSNAAMYSGPLEDPTYVYQGRSPALTFPQECGNPGQQLTVHQAIQEEDPLSPSDAMGTIGIGAPVYEGTYDFVQWAEHYEPAYLNGKRTHAGFAGGSYGAEIAMRISCANIPVVNDTVAPELSINSPSNGLVVNEGFVVVSGTATDNHFGGNGISSVSVNGVPASNSYVSGSGTASWSLVAPLNEGSNTLTITAQDNSQFRNSKTQQVTVNFVPIRGPASAPSPSPAPAPAPVETPVPVQNSRLEANQPLLPGQSLTSDNGQHALAYQGDGNLVVYSYGAPVWASNTFGNPGQAVLQGDGNFVIYDAYGTPVFHTATWDFSDSFLIIQNDGNLVLYSSGEQPLWSIWTGNLIGR